ncbi:MAG: Hint domain-containing protein [Pseudorhodobacter sp.]
MPTSFDVIYLGNLPDIDTREGNASVNTSVVNGWLGTYGTSADPLSAHVQEFAPGNYTGGIINVYDINNNRSNDTFTVDGATRTHDATMVFEATITYLDGTTAEINAVLMQATNGDVYLVPGPLRSTPIPDEIADAAALAAKPLRSIELESPIYAFGIDGRAYNLLANRYVPPGGQVVIPCFTLGTLIATTKGECLIEDLQPGDRVITRDNGVQTIRWIGQRELEAKDLLLTPGLQPVLISAGALGGILPCQDILVSPNHRMLLTSDKAELLFGQREVLVAAKHLTRLNGVEQIKTQSVTYIHLMFDHHEIILSNGTWSESFQPGDYTLQSIDKEQRNEILTLFPELAEETGLDAYGSARMSLKAHEVTSLLAMTASS